MSTNDEPNKPKLFQPKPQMIFSDHWTITSMFIWDCLDQISSRSILELFVLFTNWTVFPQIPFIEAKWLKGKVQQLHLMDVQTPAPILYCGSNTCRVLMHIKVQWQFFRCSVGCVRCVIWLTTDFYLSFKSPQDCYQLHEAGFMCGVFYLNAQFNICCFPLRKIFTYLCFPVECQKILILFPTI